MFMVGLVGLVFGWVWGVLNFFYCYIFILLIVLVYGGPLSSGHQHKNRYIPVFLLTVFGPDYYVPW